MSADAGADHRAMLALQERMDRADAETAKLQGQLKALGNRVVALENPESDMDRAHQGLAEMADKVDAATPGKVPGHSVAELAKRAAKDGVS